MIEVGKRLRFGTGITWITCLAELVVPSNVKVVCFHEPLLLGLEPGMEKALEGGLSGGPEEENVCKSHVQRGDKEAYGLHHIPAQLPERKPHEPNGLGQQEAQPTIKLPSDLGFCL